MQIIPVLDIMDGTVVHGRAGERGSYQPIVSTLVQSTDPVNVLRAMVKASGSNLAYVADLNGLMGGERQSRVLKQLAAESIDLLVDAGIQTSSDLIKLPNEKHLRVVLAAESIRSVDALREIVSHQPYRRFVFSFDFIDDQLRSQISDWTTESLPQIAELVWQLGITDWIVLDVRSVGMRGGPTSVNRCRQLRGLFPGAKITTGGGIRNRSDLAVLKQCGVDNVLVATALHRGELSNSDLDCSTTK